MTAGGAALEGRRRWVATCALLAGLGAVRTGHAQPAHLAPGEVAAGSIETEPPAIDVLTFGVGDRIFEKFGHAAICLRYHDPQLPTVCFNYGVTDFGAGASMVWDFLRSQQKFWVEPTSFRSMFSFYQREDRDVWLQTLAVTGAQARELEAKLWFDTQEAHRYYNYDHFFDNCTTRLRDMIDHATGGALHAGNDAPYPLTFREIGRRGLSGMPILLVLTDLLIGRQADDHPTVWQAMFHPDMFRQQIEVRLGVAPRLLYKRRGPAFPTDGPSGRLEVLALALAFTLPLALAQWRRRFETAALAWTTLWLVVLGAVVWGPAIVSSIVGVRYNEAVFVAMPLDLALPFLPAGLRRRYALVRIGLVVLASFLVAIGVFHQPLWVVSLAVFLPMITIALDVPNGLLARLGRERARTTATRSVADTVTGAVADTVTGAVADTVTGSVADTVTGSVADTVTGSVADTVTGSVADTVTGSVADTVTGSVADTVTGSVADTVTGSVADTVTGSVADTVTGAVMATVAVTETVTGTGTETGTVTVAEIGR